MKKIIICFSFAFFGITAFAQNEPPLTEEESQLILESSECKDFVTLQNSFIQSISNSINNGYSSQELEKFAIDLSQGKHAKFYYIVFGDEKAGEEFFNKLAQAKANFLTKFPKIPKNISGSLCKTCQENVDEQIKYFFSNFSSIEKFQYVLPGGNLIDGRAPTCGSRWNQVLTLACMAGCSATTVGLGAGLCGWGCWCSFCSQNSALATAICAD